MGIIIKETNKTPMTFSWTKLEKTSIKAPETIKIKEITVVTIYHIMNLSHPMLEILSSISRNLNADPRS